MLRKTPLESASGLKGNKYKHLIRNCTSNVKIESINKCINKYASCISSISNQFC